MQMDIEDQSNFINQLPLELLACNIFGFFDFDYWLKYFVPVCKRWKAAAVASPHEKQIWLDLSKKTTLINAHYLVSTYSVTSLVLMVPGSSMFFLESLISASPKLKSVVFFPPCTSFSTFTFNSRPLPDDMIASTRDGRITQITTLGVPFEHLSILDLFPNTEQLTIIGNISSWPPSYVKSTSVKQMEISMSPEMVTREGRKEFLKLIMEHFPALTTIYINMTFTENAPIDQIWKTLEEIGRTNGVEVRCKYPHHFEPTAQTPPDFSAISYNGYFDAVGQTPFMKLVQSECGNYLEGLLKTFPSLTNEYERSFRYRSRQFKFPWLSTGVANSRKDIGSINWKQPQSYLSKFMDLGLLPFWISKYYQMKYMDVPALEVWNSLKNADPLQIGDFESPKSVQTCAKLFTKVIGSLAKTEIGAEKLRVILNGHCGTNYVLKPLLEEVDLTDVKDLIETQTVTKLFDALVSENLLISATPLFILRLNALLKERKKEFEEIQATVLFRLLADRNFPEIEMLTDTGIFSDINDIYNSKGETLLTYAISEGYYDMVEGALKLGVDKDKPDKSGKSPIITAIEREYQAAVEILLRKGADPNIAGNTMLPLHMALTKFSVKLIRIVDTLILFGADVNKQDFDEEGSSAYPLTIAIRRGKFDRIRHLIANGADPTVLDGAGHTLLHLMHRNTSKECVALLAQYIDVNQPNWLGQTPLQTWLVQGSKQIQLLIDLGADVNRPDMFGRTPLMLAATLNRSEDNVLALLAAEKLDIRARDSSGKPFVHYLADSNPGVRLQGLLKSEKFKAACQSYITADNINFLIEEWKSLLAENKKLDMIFIVVTSNLALTQFMVEKVGLDVNHVDLLGNSLLSSMEVLGKESELVFEYLTAKGAKISSPDPNFLLWEVLKTCELDRKTLEKLKLLLSRGISIPGINTALADKIVNFTLDHVDTLENEPDINLEEMRKNRAAKQ